MEEKTESFARITRTKACSESYDSHYLDTDAAATKTSEKTSREEYAVL